MSIKDIISANAPSQRISQVPLAAIVPGTWTFGRGQVLSFDQALTNTGFVHLASYAYGDRPLAILDMGHYKYHAVEGEPQGALLTLKKTASLARWMESILRSHGDVRSVVYEMPVVAGYRTESILLGAYALHEACRNTNRPIPVAVNNQHAKRIIIGRTRGVTKAEVKGHVNDYIKNWQRPASPWNEHVVDAALLGLAWLYENEGEGRE